MLSVRCGLQHYLKLVSDEVRACCLGPEEGTGLVRGSSVVEACRSCGAPLPPPFLFLGETPVANRLLRTAASPEELYPLAVSHCPSCALVQLAFDLPHEAIFDADYPYFSSFSDAFVAHARAHAHQLIEALGLNESSLVVEIASNDGYLLKAFVERGIPVLGIEPSTGPAKAARDIGVETLEAFFTSDLARGLAADGRRADVIIANNVMAHVDDLNGFVEGMSILIKDDGVITVENPSLSEMIRHAEFDTIYHEHYSYFSSLAVDALMSRQGLGLFRIEQLPVHGGSLRWWATPSAGPRATPDASVAEMLESERAEGIDKAEHYASFAARVSDIQSDLVALIKRLRAEGASIAAYGAAAKGATLLNSSGIDHTLLDYVVDRNIHKQGLWMPGARLAILPVETLLENRPDYVLLLAWNFSEEIRRQQSDYTAGGGRFIRPVPEPVILD
jgi:SAM-dependent methyltransferase